MSHGLPLANRAEAGRLLARALMPLKPENPLVLALPRGGVPVAHEIAEALDAELDLLLVRKLGAPGHPEFAIGAIVDGPEPQIVLNDEAMRILQPNRAYVEAEIARQIAEMERRRETYLGDRKPPHLAGRTVIVVDDGIATGATVSAAIRGVRRLGPRSLILAVPVAPEDTIRKLHPLCDEIVVLAMPTPFYAVGQHYRDFRQTGDEEVIALMQRAHERQAHHQPQ